MLGIPLTTKDGDSSSNRITAISDRVNKKYDGSPRLRIVLASIAPFIGGAEIAAERLALGLLEAGHDVEMLLGNFGEVQQRMERAGLKCTYLSMPFTDRWHWLRYWKARYRIRRFLRQHKPDLVHSNDLPTHQIVSDAVRGTGIPEICHHRWIFPGTAIDWLNKFGCLHHLFVSQALMNELCDNSFRLRSSSRAVVHDGLPLPEKPTNEDRQRNKLGLPHDKTIVTFAGQMIERKGVADLLHAWSILDESIRNQAELLMIGDDISGEENYRVKMEALADELSCRVRFVGFQKNVGEWLKASDIAVVPSHAEPLGNATLEAMSFCLPVIGSSVGGIPEMIVNEETGLLVSPRSPDQLAQALRRLISDQKARIRLGSQGRLRCEEHFSLTSHVQSVVREYDRVLAPESRSMLQSVAS
jgi:glycosyltransferase involved in cell wall biosynthesis